MAMQIRLRESYRGKRTQERVIAAGDYNADDERLFGLAEYLVKNGHAVKVAGKAKSSQQETEDGLNFPDLTAAEVQAIRARYELALSLQAKWQDAKAARENAAAPLQGEAIYGVTGDVLTMDAGDTVVVPGKGVVPDVVLPKAAWQMLETTVIPNPEPAEPTTLTTAPGGEVLFVPAEQVEAFPDGYHYDADGNIVPDVNEYDVVAWDDDSVTAFADSAEYKTLVQERETALDEAGNDTRKLNKVTAEYDRKIKAAHEKWEADRR